MRHFSSSFFLAALALCLLPVLHCARCEPKPPPPPKASKAAPARANTLDQQELLVPDEETADVPDAGAVPVTAKRPKVVEKQCNGSIPAAEARQVIDSHRTQVRACYERQLRVNNHLAGDLLVGLRVVAPGRVSDVQITGTLRDRQVHSCIAALAKKWRFPSPEGDSCVLLSAPFHLEPQGG